MKKFEDLPQNIQDFYLQKAKYLIEYTYVQRSSIADLAEEIYKKDKKHHECDG